MNHHDDADRQERDAVTCLVDAGCELAESPVWDEDRRRLYWAEIPARRIHWLTLPTLARGAIELDGPVASLGLTRSGRLVVACGWDVLLVDPDRRRPTETLASLPRPAWPGRLNDGKVGPDGAFWVGGVHEVPLDRMEPRASLYRIDPGGGVREIATGLKASNGLAWSADGRIMYHSDSMGPHIDRRTFDPATGRCGPPERYLDLTAEQGRPDGGATDLAGNYWSAGVSCGVLNCFDPDARLLERIELPVPHPTMPCFGGPDMRTIFLTSHRKTMTREQLRLSPRSGGVFALRSDVPGVPVDRFAD